MLFANLLPMLIASLAPPTFVEKPCAQPGINSFAYCGTVMVPERRDTHSTRSIPLNIIVMRAITSDKKLPPLIEIVGGPGLPATINAEYYGEDGEALRDGRDHILIDQRGTGESNPLKCPELAAPEIAYSSSLPEGAVSRCRETLEKVADLTRYGTLDAVEDLNDVRRALGYETIDLIGTSYGTTVALRYLKKYPASVRAVALLGVAPTSIMAPQHHAPAAERAIKLLFQECAENPECHSKYDPEQELANALSLLASTPEAPDADVFMEKLRTLMYQPVMARRIPFIAHEASHGNLEPFYAATRPSISNIFSGGMFLSIICSESMNLLDYEKAATASRATRFGDYRLRRQKASCQEWPTAEVDQDHLEPTRSDAAVLMISGEFDPVTPPSWAEEMMSFLPNAAHVIIPASGHIYGGMSGDEECIQPLIVDFLRYADPKNLDTSCVERMQPPDFYLGE